MKIYFEKAKRFSENQRKQGIICFRRQGMKIISERFIFQEFSFFRMFSRKNTTVKPSNQNFYFPTEVFLFLQSILKHFQWPPVEQTFYNQRKSRNAKGNFLTTNEAPLYVHIAFTFHSHLPLARRLVQRGRFEQWEGLEVRRTLPQHLRGRRHLQVEVLQPLLQRRL